MYVVSSRPRRVSAGKNWTVLSSANGLPSQPPDGPSNFLSAGFLSSLRDPLVIFIHGFATPEPRAFEQYAVEIGTNAVTGKLFANGFTGSAIGFDWPSFDTPVSGPIAQYRSDLLAARNNGVRALGDFLNRLTTALRGTGIRVNLMAHSMGNLVVRQTLLADPALAAKLDNIISFAPDLPQTDMARPDVIAVANALPRNWFVYWAQADFVLLTLSNLGNIIIGEETWGGQRLGQQGLLAGAPVSPRVVAQEWDSPLAADLGSTYNWDLHEWPFNGNIHSLYWTNKPFLANVAANLQRAPGAAPITVTWPLPPRP